jgi:hypothetical protein
LTREPRWILTHTVLKVVGLLTCVRLKTNGPISLEADVRPSLVFSLTQVKRPTTFSTVCVNILSRCNRKSSIRIYLEGLFVCANSHYSLRCKRRLYFLYPHHSIFWTLTTTSTASSSRLRLANCGWIVADADIES